MVLKDKIDLFLKKPTAKSGRHSFALIKRVRKPNGAVEYKTLASEPLESVNREFKAGTQDFATSERLAKEILRQVKDKECAPKAGYCQSNLNSFDRFWDTEYEQKRRKLLDKRGAKNDFLRALSAADTVSLAKADKAELQKQIDRFRGNHQRRICSRLNQILKFLGRPFVLELDTPDDSEIQYLTEADLHAVMVHVPVRFRLLFLAAFYTGMRFGELLALRAEDYNEVFISVQWQIDERGERRRPKWRKTRYAIVIPAGREHVKAWCELPVEEKEKLRTSDHRRPLTAACQKVFPSDPRKHCTIHDLRHGTGIHLRRQRVSTAHIAGVLGNSESVVRKHYTGQALTLEELTDIQAKLLAGTPSPSPIPPSSIPTTTHTEVTDTHSPAVVPALSATTA